MKITASLLTFAALALGVAANNDGGAPAAKENIDTTILNYALTLEYLEADFYKGILARFDKHAFKAEGFNFATYQRVRELARQEAVHVTTLQTVLGADATSACEYSFPYNTVSEALALSSVLESVGVSAYLGAANLITDPAYLTAAGSILAVEARHQAILSEINTNIGFPSPFDTPLGFSQVYSLAAPFITSCPSTNPTLPVVQFGALTTGPVGGARLQLNFECNLGDTPLYAHIYSGLSVIIKHIEGDHTIEFPQDLEAGVTYIVVSTSPDQAVDSNTINGPAIVNIPDKVQPLFYRRDYSRV